MRWANNDLNIIPSFTEYHLGHRKMGVGEIDMKKKDMGLLVILFLGFCIAGCSTTGHYHLYSGQNADPRQMAVLEGRGPLILEEVDGKVGPNLGMYNGINDGTFSVEFPPGTHELKVSYHSISYAFGNRTTRSSVGSVKITLEAQAGALYFIKPNLLGSGWNPAIERIR
jgi:hypothetical protein